MREVVLVDGVRSAFGKMGGALRSLPATDIGGFVVKGLVERTGIMERGDLDGVFAGAAFVDCQTNTQARYIALKAGLPYHVSGTYVEMQCGSAITALNLAAYKIACGGADALIVGGMEAHSRRVAKFSMSQDPYKLIPPTAIPNKLAVDPAQNTDMITNNDLMAKIWNISRQECDEFSARSQQRMGKAISSGFTGPEIVPYVFPATKKTPEIVVDKDEHPRPNTTYEDLSKLRPIHEDGVTTAGNSSGLNDGAAFLLLMSGDKARELGYEPYARWIFGADEGCQPNLMGIGAAYSTLKALKACGLKLSDIDVFECNEAFAAQNLCVIKEMQEQMGEIIDQEKWNPNGGAISIGHPNGASGGRISIFAMKQLEKIGGRYGVITSCCGGGVGTTAIIENLRK